MRKFHRLVAAALGGEVAGVPSSPTISTGPSSTCEHAAIAVRKRIRAMRAVALVSG